MRYAALNQYEGSEPVLNDTSVFHVVAEVTEWSEVAQYSSRWPARNMIGNESSSARYAHEPKVNRWASGRVP